MRQKKKFPLWLQILLALFFGTLYGLFLPDYTVYVDWMGNLFMRALKMIIIPLILTSIISGVANIGTAENLGRLGLRTFIYYMLSSLAAILTGLFFVNLLKPGVGADLGLRQSVENLPAAQTTLKDLLLRIVPTNIFDAFARGDMLQIIFFAILFGFFISKIKSEHRLLLTNLFNGAFETVMKLTNFIILFAPLGIFGLIARIVAQQDNFGQLVGSLGLYMLTVILGLSFHAFITLPLVQKFVAKVKPLRFFRAMSDALLMAFSTSSSGATLPLTMDRIQTKVGVSNKVASFTLPLGATVNMDGTALYELVAAMFIAQAYGIEMSFTQQFIAVLTALLASIGAAGIPMAGLIMITVILSALGLPMEGIGLILAVDRILDMFRTSVNVWSDSTAAVTIARLEGEKFKIDDNEN